MESNTKDVINEIQNQIKVLDQRLNSLEMLIIQKFSEANIVLLFLGILLNKKNKFSISTLPIFASLVINFLLIYEYIRTINNLFNNYDKEILFFSVSSGLLLIINANFLKKINQQMFLLIAAHSLILLSLYQVLKTTNSFVVTLS